MRQRHDLICVVGMGKCGKWNLWQIEALRNVILISSICRFVVPLLAIRTRGSKNCVKVAALALVNDP